MPSSSTNTVDLRFTLQREEFTLDVGISLPASGITGVFGPSGAGKSSLLRCIAGLERASEGHLVVGDDVWDDTSTGVRRDPHRRSIGYVFQDARLFPHLDVRANLMYGAKRSQRDDSAAQFEHIVRILGLEALLDRRPATLSGGEGQRVAIGRAMMRGPDLMLFDEPLASLDAARKGEVLPLIERLRDRLGIPMIYVSHNIDEICHLADSLVVLDRGRVAAQGEPQAVLMRTSLPVIGNEEAGTVIRAQVQGNDDEYCITHARFSGGDLWLPGRHDEVGAQIRVRIRANDVSLCLQPPLGSTILNVLPVTIAAIDPEGDARALIRLSCGDDQLLARITRKSLETLDLRQDKQVYAQIKSVVVR